MKKTIPILVIVLLLLVGGCGAVASTEQPSKVLPEQDFGKFLASANDYKDYQVEFYGKAFNSYTQDGNLYLQVHTDIKKSDGNVIVKVTDPQYKTSNDEYIHVIAIVHGTLEGINALGAKLVTPATIAKTIEKVDYIDAVSPTLKTIEVNKEINQHGIIVKLQKIELAKDETRVYFEVTNNSQDKASFYSFNTKLVQGDKQFEEESNYDADYKSVQSELLPGIKTDGIVAFKAIDAAVNKVTVIAEARSDDYMQNFVQYKFDITWK